jgi:hypothetical protein
MAKVLGLREQRVQFFYDTDFKTQGVTASSSRDYCVPEKILFATASGQGDLSRTNIVTPGQLSSDQTFLTFAVRHELNFFAADGASGQSVETSPNLVSVAELSIWVLANSAFQYKVSEKVEFEGPLSMTPAGGGSWGYVNDSASPLINNGNPAAPSIYVLPLPIAVTKRQAIQMIEKKATFQAGGGGAFTTDINICAAVNTFEGGKMLRAYIDGYNTRDVL